MHVLSWNVSGVKPEEFDVLLDSISSLHQWDVLLIQEGLHSFENINAHNHFVFTPSELTHGIGCPLIVVNHRWDGRVKQIASGVHWVAVEFNESCIFVSAYLPQPKHDLSTFRRTLDEVDICLQSFTSHALVVGLDANTKLSGFQDFLHIGPAIIEQHPEKKNSERAAVLHNFLVERSLRLVNTFVDYECASLDDLITFPGWSGTCSSQIDFIAASLSLVATDVFVDRDLYFTTNHRPVAARFSLHPSGDKIQPKHRCYRNWRPSESWALAASNTSFDWHNWSTASATFRALVADHRFKRARCEDLQLQHLLYERKQTPFGERRDVEKRIYRYRRMLKRRRQTQALEHAASKNQAPAQKRSHNHISWQKIVGDQDPGDSITKFFESIYSLTPAERSDEIAEKQRYVKLWHDFRIDILSFGMPAARLNQIFRKLKKGKASPDGITAEMLQALPDGTLETFAAFVAALLASLDIPSEWCQAFAILLPKVIGADSLTKFRPIACLPTMRKMMGYVFIRMLPPLRFDSLQTGFVPRAQGADGVYIIKRCAELSREWKHELYVVQLDLSKAFDRVKHSAAIKALKLQGASVQCIALFCSLMLKSTLAFSLGGVRSESVLLERGLPQCAPESPLVFVLITELVLRPLLARWRDRGSGWSIDGLFVAAVCYADDIVLLSSCKDDLHRMLHEVVEGFASVGLSIGAAKTHWTSLPSRAGDTLNVLDVEVAWESDFTFIGGVIDLGGSEAKAIDYRIAQATKAWGLWRRYVVCKGIPPMKKCSLVYRAVFSSALWLAQCWVPTKAQMQKMNSWGARLLAHMYGVR